MGLAGVDVQMDDEVRLGERSEEEGKESSPGTSEHGAKRELAMKVPVHDHQAEESCGAPV
ncbi:hypothetical protein ASPU41_14775 [Arthrobacter sp. U41]|nr:hypothetical protein ASPU41_14775 [Arthrobacter sp. U41]